jgi:hypothetical protein
VIRETRSFADVIEAMADVESGRVPARIVFTPDPGLGLDPSAQRDALSRVPLARRPRGSAHEIVSGTARICPRISPPGFFGVWTFT